MIWQFGCLVHDDNSRQEERQVQERLGTRIDRYWVHSEAFSFSVSGVTIARWHIQATVKMPAPLTPLGTAPFGAQCEPDPLNPEPFDSNEWPLDLLGRLGWELVSVLPARTQLSGTSSYPAATSFYLKRPQG